MTDDLNYVVRRLVRTLLALDPTTVRPADQIAPTGTDAAEFVSVRIGTADDNAGWNYSTPEDPDHPGTLIETLDQGWTFTASVQFYKTSLKDTAGVPSWSTVAFDKATRLKQLLGMDGSIELMKTLGIGLLDMSEARNLSGVGGPKYESRGQVDLTFMVVNRTTVAGMAAIASAEIGLKYQSPGGTIETRDIEVTT